MQSVAAAEAKDTVRAAAMAAAHATAAVCPVAECQVLAVGQRAGDLPTPEVALREREGGARTIATTGVAGYEFDLA